MPDGRFYTKANFFTLADRERAELAMEENDSMHGKLNSGGGTMGENGAVPFPQAYNKQNMKYN